MVTVYVYVRVCGSAGLLQSTVEGHGGLEACKGTGAQLEEYRWSPSCTLAVVLLFVSAMCLCRNGELVGTAPPIPPVHVNLFLGARRFLFSRQTDSTVEKESRADLRHFGIWELILIPLRRDRRCHARC